MKKPAYTVLLEAVFVGILLIVIYRIVDKLFPIVANATSIHPAYIQNKNVTLFLAGAIFHILCEITGINIWYVNNYNEILQK